MKTKLFTAFALAVLTTTAMSASSAQASGADDKALESKSGKALHCTAKVKFKNALDQTIEIDSLRLRSASDAKFFTEYKLGGSRYRPVSGATIRSPNLKVQVPDGHKLAVEVTYRTQRTAGKNGAWSRPKTAKFGASAVQPACTLGGQTINVTID
ncbi:MAG: hypothetical protein AAF721_04065 [Myxococcota bacterium]